jgi:hypothetical protein
LCLAWIWDPFEFEFEIFECRMHWNERKRERKK